MNIWINAAIWAVIIGVGMWKSKPLLYNKMRKI